MNARDRLHAAVREVLAKTHWVHLIELNMCAAMGITRNRKRKAGPTITRLANARARSFVAAELAEFDRAVRSGDGSRSIFYDRAYWSAH